MVGVSGEAVVGVPGEAAAAGGGKGSVGVGDEAGNRGRRTRAPEVQEGASRPEGEEGEEEAEAEEAAPGAGSGKGANLGTACGIPDEIRRARLLRKRYTRCREKWTRMSVCIKENINALDSKLLVTP